MSLLRIISLHILFQTVSRHVISLGVTAFSEAVTGYSLGTAETVLLIVLCPANLKK